MNKDILLHRNSASLDFFLIFMDLLNSLNSINYIFIQNLLMPEK